MAIKLNPGETSLVVAGAWNPAVVTPQWMIRHGLQKPPGEQVRVQAQVPTGVGMNLGVPTYTIEGLIFNARPDALVLAPVSVDEGSLLQLEEVARRTLEQLTHTPVVGVGHNFEFSDETPDATRLNAFTAAGRDISDIKPVEWQSSRSAIATSFIDEGVVINIARSYDANGLKVKFNFHQDVESAPACVRVLDSTGRHSMYRNYLRAREIVVALYGDIDEN